MDPADLERQVQRALEGLPPVRAPRTLTPRVMQALRVPRAPWYARPWSTWPGTARLVSAVSMVPVVWAVLLVLPAVQNEAGRLAAVVASESSPLVMAADTLRALWSAAEVLRRASAPVLGYAAGLTLLMSGAFAVVGAAMTHVMWGGSPRS
jgi:hypothetical protein